MKEKYTIVLYIATAVLTVILTATTFTPIIARSVRSDPTRVNIYIHKFQSDYMYYVSGIVRGQHGSFLFKDPFSVPNPPAAPVQLLFPIIGMLSAPFHIWAPVSYHIARVLLIFFSIWATYVLAVTVLKNKVWGSIATLMSMIVTNPPVFLYSQKIALSFYAWWDMLNSYERFDALPHYVAARGLQCLSIVCYFKFRSTKQRRLLIISSLLATLCVFMAAQTVLPYLAVVSVGTLWDFVLEFRKAKRLNTSLRSISPLLIIICPLVAIGVIEVSTQTPIWLANRKWEVAYFSQDPWTIYHLYISYIFLMIPAYAGLAIGLRRKELSSSLLAVWCAIPLLVSPILPLLGTGGARFDIQMNLVIPFSILAAIAVRYAVRTPTWKTVLLIYFAVVCLYSSISTASYAKAQWDFIYTENLSTRMYPPRQYFELVDWVKANVKQDQVIVSSEEIGSLLVSQTPVFAYIGEQTHGANWDIYTGPHQRFYGEQMSNSEALTWLKNHDVSYVIEDPLYIWPLRDLSYPFLVKKWHNSQLGIYQVRYDTTR